MLVPLIEASVGQSRTLYKVGVYIRDAAEGTVPIFASLAS